MTLLFIFDMDEVLYDYDWRARMASMTELTGHDIHELRRRWWHDGGEWAAEAGQFASGAEYLRAVNRAFDSRITEAEWLQARGSAMTARPDALDAVRRASELGRITLLTNNGPLAHENLSTLAPELVALFDDQLFASSHYGARKPDPLVFERVLTAYDTAPSRAFFADDMEVNVDGARSVGITSYHYGNAAGLMGAIETFAVGAAA